jgi:hypothetical protein
MDLDVQFSKTQVLAPASLSGGESIVIESNKEKL